MLFCSESARGGGARATHEYLSGSIRTGIGKFTWRKIGPNKGLDHKQADGYSKWGRQSMGRTRTPPDGTQEGADLNCSWNWGGSSVG